MTEYDQLAFGGAIPNDGDEETIGLQTDLFTSLANRSWRNYDGFEPLSIPWPLSRITDTVELSLDPISDGAIELLRSWSPYDQGHYRSTCVAFSVLSMVELFERLRPGENAIANYSEEFLYYMMREKHKPAMLPNNYENGSTFMDQAASALEASGICDDAIMPYNSNIEEPAYVEEPSPEAIDAALERRFSPDSFAYSRLIANNPTLWKSAGLVNIIRTELKAGNPVSAAFPIYKRDNQWNNEYSIGWRFGAVEDPTEHDHVVDVFEANEQNNAIIGGHAVCIVGYFEGDATTDGRFVFRNSWGDRFAVQYDHEELNPKPPRRGYGTVSATHVENHCWELFLRKHV